MKSIAIVDYGMGNLRSVANGFRRVCPDAKIQITADANVIEAADRVVFPGQGAMPDCMRQLKASGLGEVVLQAAKTKPFLGICLGLQMLYGHSEEGNCAGLGILPGTVVRFKNNRQDAMGLALKVPNMGWCQVKPLSQHPLWTAIEDNAWFYFVHSYHVVPRSQEDWAALCHYGHDYCCAIAHDNIFSVQFHPEKSGSVGLQLLYNFSIWQPFSG